MCKTCDSQRLCDLVTKAHVDWGGPLYVKMCVHLYTSEQLGRHTSCYRVVRYVIMCCLNSATDDAKTSTLPEGSPNLIVLGLYCMLHH